jgi:hydrogenase nickel incorporation protein HypA/HybF
MSVCQALLMQVDAIARQRGAGTVVAITVEIGPLSGVDPAQLRSAFAVMRIGSSCAAAELLIETAVIEVRCLVCGADSATLVNRLVCRACGGFRTRVIAGDELRLRRVELEV